MKLATRLATTAWLVGWVGGGVAEARVVMYVAKAGDTAETIAADFYGNRSLALLLAEGNGVGKDVKLRAGQKVKIPTAVTYKLKRGDTLEALAQRFLEDKRRAPQLAQLNGLKVTDKLKEGQELVIPFQHVHKAEASESLQAVSRAFYGDTSKAKLLQDFNFRPFPQLNKGDKVVVPIGHVHIRAARLKVAVMPPKETAPPRPTLEPAPALVAQAREQELATRVGASLKEAERAYREGGYAEVPAQLDKLLTAEDPSEAQLAEIFRLKAFAYVALGMEELAVGAFQEVLSRRPDLVLDEATVSPKIRSAFEKAQKVMPSGKP